MIFDFLELEPKSFGLDISDLSIKIACLKKKGRFFGLKSWGEVKLKKGIIEDGEIKYEDSLIKEIKNTLKEFKGEKLDTRNVIASLPEKKSFLQVVKMPKMDPEELKTAIFFEAENHIPFPIEKVYLDYEVLPSENKVLIAAISKKIADSYFSCLRKAGLTVRALEIESQSITRALAGKECSLKTNLIIDLGKSVTSFIICHDGSINFTSSVDMCSEYLTEVIANSLKVTLKEAEKLKIKHGFNDSGDKEAKKVAKAIEPVLEKLKDQIKKYINYYQNHNKKGKIDRIVLCGRGANLINLSEYLSFELKTPTIIANPWINILPKSLKEVPGLSYKESLGYTTALGLALRGIKKK